MTKIKKVLGIDIPLTYSKDMIVYNSEKISGYTFKGEPCFLDIKELQPAK
jgi:peptide/nickel transport system substrate-binding protein/nickel transport system substrate-binding protein